MRKVRKAFNALSGVLPPVRAQIEKHGDRDGASAAVGAPFPADRSNFSADGEVVTSAISELVRPYSCVSEVTQVVGLQEESNNKYYFHGDRGNISQRERCFLHITPCKVSALSRLALQSSQ